MRIVQLIPGAGGTFYCENCLRDGAAVRTLHAMGHDVLAVPLYLPPRSEQTSPDNETPLFFGGVNVYLQQRWELFRRTPRWLDRLFDCRALLKRVARRSGMTDAALLGETLLSMLRGEDGRQAKELDRLVGWLSEGPRPDVVCLSNALLLGLARRIREQLHAPVVCMLQDEQIFLEGLADPYREQAMELLRQRAAHVDAFVAVSEFYAREMVRLLGLSAEKVFVVRNGIDAADYAPAPAAPNPPAIGFLSQMTRAKGLATLVEAFVVLKREPRHAALKLRVAGGSTRADEPYLRDVRRRIDEAGVADDVEFIEHIDRRGKQGFLQSVSVMSVPTVRGEAFGLFALESLASGVPVVLPRHGAFIELVEATRGGLLCEPNDVEDLARVMQSLLDNPGRAREMGRRGRQAVQRDFTTRKMADGMIRVFETVTGVNA